MDATNNCETAIQALPVHMQEGVRRYLYKGQPPGGFLRAVLCNDLERALMRADDINKAALGDYGALLGALPADAWGSAERIANWVKNGGLEGMSV